MEFYTKSLYYIPRSTAYSCLMWWLQAFTILLKFHEVWGKLLAVILNIDEFVSVSTDLHLFLFIFIHEKCLLTN